MHTHYKGTGKVHSFRGFLLDGKQKEISIQGSVGAIAWRITKFEIMPENPGEEDYESSVSIWREKQSSVSTSTAAINFTNGELLGVGYYVSGTVPNTVGGMSGQTIFDNALFMRNIFVTHTNAEGSGVGGNMNYYIELEEVTVSAAGMAQLAVAAARRTATR